MIGFHGERDRIDEQPHGLMLAENLGFAIMLSRLESGHRRQSRWAESTVQDHWKLF